MRKWLNTYFDLSKGEFNGLLFMALLVFLISIIPNLYRFIYPHVEDIPAEQRAIRRLTSSYKLSGDKPRGLFYFDPNLITSEEWQKLGLSKSQAGSILKYRTKGGSFKSADDLAKMYTISPEVYVRIAPYVRIQTITKQNEFEDQKNGTSADKAEKVSKPIWAVARSAIKSLPIIEINQADSSMLEEISGIGPAFARRILKYRERLGGFHKKEQLLEVFGLDSIKFEEIEAQVRVDESLVKKIRINNITFEELKNHPYLRYKQINAIIQYRKHHGDYTSIEDLERVVLLDEEAIKRLAPYLIF